MPGSANARVLHNILHIHPGGVTDTLHKDIIAVEYLILKNQNQVVFIFRNLSFFGFPIRVNLKTNTF